MSLEGDAPSLGPDTRIDDRDVHGSRWKVSARAFEEKSPRADVLGRHVVRDVDDVRVGADAGDDALHHAYVRIARAEIGEKRDDRARAHGAGRAAKWRSRASSRPATVYGSADTSTRTPCSRAVSAVMGPMTPTTALASSAAARGPSARQSSVTVELDVNVTASISPASRSAASLPTAAGEA